MQSSLSETNSMPRHVAIIMDGNGRWARQRGLPRIEGHRQGLQSVRKTVDAAIELGISTVSVYAFSSDNWKRPKAEVQTLMNFFYDYLTNEQQTCLEKSIKLSVIGRRDRLSWPLRSAIAAAERVTARGSRLHFRIAIDYSARHSIIQAFSMMRDHPAPDYSEVSYWISKALHDGNPVPDVDLLIRTSGEQRLSDFLLWESAYAEFYFTPVLWPDFDGTELRKAVEEFLNRTRKFGAVPKESVQEKRSA